MEEEGKRFRNIREGNESALTLRSIVEIRSIRSGTRSDYNESELNPFELT